MVIVISQVCPILASNACPFPGGAWRKVKVWPYYRGHDGTQV